MSVSADLEARLYFEDGRESAAYQRVVINDQHADEFLRVRLPQFWKL